MQCDNVVNATFGVEQKNSESTVSIFICIIMYPCFWCERLEERHALVFFLTTHGVGWGGAVFTFLQLAHAGDAHAMNATLLMGWCGVGLCSGSFNLHTLVMHTP